MTRFALHLLGAPRLELDGEDTHISRRKAMALLAYLAVTGRGHQREALATLLWPEHDQSSARAELRRTLSVLNRELGGDGILADRETAQLNPELDLSLDVTAFRQTLAACETHGHPATEVCSACVPLLEQAVALYHDDFLAGFTLDDSAAFDEWQFFQTEGLRDAMAGALARLVEWYGDQGESGIEPAIAYARRWLSLDSLHEPAHRHLMALYAQSGQRSAVLRQYREYVRLLEEELGVEPDVETLALFQAIQTGKLTREQRGGGEADETPRAPTMPPHNLPVQLTACIGREAEIAALQSRLRDPGCRLLTLVGPGGIGKTRLVLEFATTQLPHFANGVFFVALASLQSVNDIVPTIAQALGFAMHSKDIALEQQLQAYLANKTLLLILDNVEHLLRKPPSPGEAHGMTSAATVVTGMLQAAPNVRIMVTSRARLNVLGEHVFPMNALAYPETSSEQSDVLYATAAVQLFVQSAGRLEPEFHLDDTNVRDVAEICRLVQGMPLAILLAAGWTALLSPAEIAAQIAGDLEATNTQGVDFLQADWQDIPAQQRSLRAVFDHSWRLLTPHEQAVVQALSVFRGGFAIATAREVAEATLRDLRVLSDTSLLERVPGKRYTMHPLLQQYAAEKLAQDPAAARQTRERHCAYYAQAAQQWRAGLLGPQIQDALTEMSIEIENVIAAWYWAVAAGNSAHIWQMAPGLLLFFESHGASQMKSAIVHAAIERLEAMEGEEDAGDRLRALAALLRWDAEGLPDTEALPILQKSLALLNRPELSSYETREIQAIALLKIGRIMSRDGRGEARQFLQQSLELERVVGLGGVYPLLRLGDDAWFSGELETARRYYTECLAAGQAIGSLLGIARALSGLGKVAHALGQKEESSRLYQESLNTFRKIGRYPRLAEGLYSLALDLIMWQAEFAQAIALLRECEAICLDLGIRDWEAFSFLRHSQAEMHLGHYEAAQAQLYCALDFVQCMKNRYGVAWAYLVSGCVTLAEMKPAEAAQQLQDSVHVFQATGPRTKQSCALATLGYALCMLDQPIQALEVLAKALRIGAESNYIESYVYALPGIALLLAKQGKIERAVELYALTSSQYLLVAKSHWFEDVVGQRVASAAAATLPPDVIAAAQARGRARDVQATVKEMLVEFETREAA